MPWQEDKWGQWVPMAELRRRNGRRRHLGGCCWRHDPSRRASISPRGPVWLLLLFHRILTEPTPPPRRHESPDARFRDGLPADYRRITDLETFNALFLWRERRTVSKYGRIKLHGNQYPVTSVPHGSVVEVRFDPYDLAQLAIYDPGGGLLETTSASKQVTTQVPAVPEESRAKPPEVSAAARDYFTRLREQHHARLRDRNQTSFAQFRTNDQEHHDADA